MAACGAFAGVVALWAFVPGLLQGVVTVALTALFVGTAGLRLAAAVTPGRSCDVLAPLPSEAPIYTVLCALHREAAGMADLTAALQRLEYPREKLDVKLVLEADDAETIAAAALHAPSDWEIVLTPPAHPRTKPKALNYALAGARGAFVTVYDAEDRPDPSQLRAAVAAFARDDRLGCVQAPLVIDNSRAGWLARQFGAEYAVLFVTVLPFFARLGLPFPLGGTSNHFRRAALEGAGAWDPFNVTEDADIGYRLARDGWRLGLIGPPTWEEAPRTVAAWTAQRSRWIKGHLQTWLVVMRSPLEAARTLGAFGFLGLHLMLAGGVACALLHAPLLALALVEGARDPARGAMLGAMALAGYGAYAAAAARAAARLNRGWVFTAALSTPLYWPLALPAAARALFEFAFRPHYWAKTQHCCPYRETPTQS